MESERFDRLVRQVARGASRRELLHRAAGLVVGAVVGLRGRPAAALDCPSGTFVCGQGSQAIPACCPFPQACCHSTGQCCAITQYCQRSASGDICREHCALNEHPCGGDGDCCSFFDGTCCGEGNRTCCRAPNICDHATNGPSACATPCDLFSRHCATTGTCCPYDQKCCGADCCYPGEVCHQNTKCAKPRKRRRRH